MSVDEIRRDYEAGANYRQLAKKYRKSFTQISKILHSRKGEGVEGEVSKAGSSEFAGRLSRLEGKVAGLSSRLGVVDERFRLLEQSLDWRFRDGSSCVHLDGEGYCLNWVFKSPVKGWKMKEAEGGYLLRVQEHRWICALCPSFISKNFANEYLKRMNELIEVAQMLLARLQPAR
jgi:hypothetical protein